jgi:hypothetical protein
MKLTDILNDLMSVAELLKPHVRDGGDEYHAQIVNSLTAAHGAASELEAVTAAAPAPAGDTSATILEAIGAVGKAVEALVPSTEPVLNAIEALGGHLSDLSAVVHDVKAALAAPAPTTQQQG